MGNERTGVEDFVDGLTDGEFEVHLIGQRVHRLGREDALRHLRAGAMWRYEEGLWGL